MPLQLNINSKIQLLDLNLLNNPNCAVGTVFNEPILIQDQSYPNQDNGKIDVLNNNESFTIEEPFLIQVLLIEALLPFNLTLSQPGYTIQLTTPSESLTYVGQVTTQTNCVQLVTMFGLWDSITITSNQDGNTIKWMVLGNRASALTNITINDNQPTSPTNPQLMLAATAVAIAGNPGKQFLYVKGQGGPVTLTSSPVIQPGAYLNQEIAIIGTDDTDTVTIPYNGTNGVSLEGNVTLGLDDVINLYWNGTYWSEENRR